MAEIDIQEEFEKAAKYLRGIVGKLDSSDLLFFYARFKQAKEGPNQTAKPGFFEFQGKQKWQAWADLKDMPKEWAMEEYVDKLTDIDPDWAGKEPEAEKSWVTVSAMSVPQENIVADKDKTVFDWAKEGHFEKVREFLSEDSSLKDEKDDEGMSLIHWVADRGHDDTLKILIEDFKVDVNVTDSEGQSPLHYAASCNHISTAQILINAGADRDLCDNDGFNPIKAYEGDNEKMKELLRT